jgi:hypothetical protein
MLRISSTVTPGGNRANDKVVLSFLSRLYFSAAAIFGMVFFCIATLRGSDEVALSCGPTENDVMCTLNISHTLRDTSTSVYQFPIQDIQEMRVRVLDAGNEIPLSRVALDEDGEPRFPQLPFEFVPFCWIKYVTRAFSLFLRVKGGQEFEIPAGFTDYNWVKTANFRLSLVMYRKLVVEHPASTAVLLDQLQDIQAQMTKEMFGQIPRFKQMRKLVEAAKQVGANEPELKTRVEAMLALASKLYAPLKVADGDSEYSEEVYDDQLLTVLQLAGAVKLLIEYCTVCTLYSMHAVQYARCTVCTMYSMRAVQYARCTVCTLYTI